MSPLKWCGKGSLLLPCPKIPFYIFLFASKSDFQKSKKNGEKRKKPRKSRVFRLASFLSRRIEMCWQKRCRLFFLLTKSFSSAIWAFCDTRTVAMNSDIYLIPFRLKFGFAFRADIRLENHNAVQNNGQDKYRDCYKIPRDIEMATKPINLTRRKHESGKKQKQRNKYLFHYSTAFLSLL